MVFQHILTAINYAAPELRHFLGGLNTTTAEQLIGSAYFFFGAVSFRQSIRDRKEQAKSKASTDESAPAGNPPPDFQVEGLKRVHQSLKAAFPSDARIGEEEKDRIIGRTLAAMLEDPPGAAEFVREVEKAS